MRFRRKRARRFLFAIPLGRRVFFGLFLRRLGGVLGLCAGRLRGFFLIFFCRFHLIRLLGFVLGFRGLNPCLFFGFLCGFHPGCFPFGLPGLRTGRRQDVFGFFPGLVLDFFGGFFPIY